MALVLAESMIARDGVDEADLMPRFIAWHEKGDYSCTGTCFDIGVTTRQALARYKKTGNTIAGSTHAHTAGNDSLMRLAPVAIRYWNESRKAIDAAKRQNVRTHGAAETLDACAAYAQLLCKAISGQTKSELLNPSLNAKTPALRAILQGDWKKKTRSEIQSSGYVIHSLEAALWCVGRATDFRSAVVLAANLGDDADTVAAITGQLAGALWGVSGIPREWLSIAWHERLESAAAALFEASRPS